jgi:hypothetical protein
LDENSTYSLLKKGIYLFPSLRLWPTKTI